MTSQGPTIIHSNTLSPPSSPPPIVALQEYGNEDLNIIFRRFDNIVEPKKSTLTLRKDKSKSKSVLPDKKASAGGTPHNEMTAEVSAVLRRLQAVMRSKKYTLAALFYERMVSSQKILSEAQTLHYQQVLSLYLDVLDTVPNEIRQGMGEFAYNLLLFLQSHTIDPDSALIGLSPADDVVHKLSENADFTDSCKLSKDELVKHIVKWSQLTEGDAILQSVRACAASFRGVDKLRRGDVAVVRLLSGKFVFGRVAGERSENSINFYTDPLETCVVPVDNSNVWPITKAVADGMKDAKGMEKLIRQAVETFFATLHQEVKALTVNSLSAMGINAGVTDRATELTMTLSDLDDLKFITTKLSQVYADHTTPVFAQCEHLIKSKVDEYLAQLDPKTMFMPKYNSTMQVLREYPKIPLARSRVRQLLGTCELALDQLKSSMRKILNGGLKAQITEWWLKKIETKVNAFLEFHGYEFTAVPDNYIEQPPENLEAVRANLIIVTKTLDPQAPPEASPLLLIKELRAEIYPVIDDFMRSSIITLSDHLELDSKSLLNLSTALSPVAGHAPDDTPLSSLEFNVTPAIPILKAALDKKIATSTATLASSSEPSPLSANMALLFEQLGDMIRDLEYLCSMKALENNPAPSEKSLHIVPIGGLVIGSFLRLENELKTVIELWDVQDEPFEGEPDTTAKRSRAESEAKRRQRVEEVYKLTSDDSSATEFISEEATELHGAVCSGSAEKVRVALSSPQIRATINTPDPHGWTPLHMAAVLGNLDVCNLLLGVEGVDVTAVNEKGGVVLHYVVKHPHSPEQTAIVQKLIVLHPALLTAKNCHGETPLHSACLKANHNVVAQLVLPEQADVNCLTIGGEAPLHYAVTVGSDAVVDVLLQAGADPSIEAKRGTPLDLALGYKHLGIATALRKALGMADDHGWPRTTRTPPGQHDAPEPSPDTTDRSDHVNREMIDEDLNSASNIKIGIRQPHRVSMRTRARIPDKPLLLELSKPSELSDKPSGLSGQSTFSITTKSSSNSIINLDSISAIVMATDSSLAAASHSHLNSTSEQLHPPTGPVSSTVDLVTTALSSVSLDQLSPTSAPSITVPTESHSITPCIASTSPTHHTSYSTHATALDEQPCTCEDHPTPTHIAPTHSSTSTPNASATLTPTTLSDLPLPLPSPDTTTATLMATLIPPTPSTPTPTPTTTTPTLTTPTLTTPTPTTPTPTTPIPTTPSPTIPTPTFPTPTTPTTSTTSTTTTPTTTNTTTRKTIHNLLPGSPYQSPNFQSHALQYQSLSQSQPPQLPTQELSESPTNWHTAKIRRGNDPVKRNMVALRTHNKTHSDGSMSFLTKIQSDLHPTNNSREAGKNAHPITKGFDTTKSPRRVGAGSLPLSPLHED